MTSTDLEPLPIPFGTKADGTQYTWPTDFLMNAASGQSCRTDGERAHCSVCGRQSIS